MDRKHYKELAKASISQPGQKMAIFTMQLPAILISVASLVVLGIGSSIDNIIGGLLSVVGYVGFLSVFMVSIVMSMGTFDILLTNAKYNRTITFRDWWEGKQIKVYFMAFWFGAVVQLIKGVPSTVLGFIPILGTIAGFIISYIVGVKLMYVQTLKIDHPEIGLMDALKLSFNLTGGSDVAVVKDYLLLTISLIPQYLQMLLPVWNVIYALPVIQLTYMHLYLDLSRQFGITSESIKESASDIDDAIDNAMDGAGEFAKAGANAASAMFGKLTDKLNDFADKNGDENKKAPRLEKKAVEVVEESGFELESSVLEGADNNIYDTMVKAIRDMGVVDINWNGDKVRALPIDIVVKNGKNVYNFFVQKDGDIKPVQISEDEIAEIKPNGKHFDPTKYVTWKPNWQISRDWDI